MDDHWAMDKIVAHERELGRSEARHDAADAAITRIAGEMEKGFTQMRQAQEQGFNHLRGEMKTSLEMIGGQIDEIRQERADFSRGLKRIGWAIIAAVIAAAAAQTALSPQIAGMAVQALGQVQ